MGALITIKDAMSRFNVPYHAVYNKIAWGKIPTVRKAGRVLIDEDDLKPELFNETLEPQLPVLRNTGLIVVRDVNGHQAFTVNDIATALQVNATTIRARFSENQAAWLGRSESEHPYGQPETWMTEVQTTSGAQQVRVFSARGAMRFCRHIKSERSDQLFNHLLDLWEAERGGEKRLVDTEALMSILSELKELRERVSQPQITDPKLLIAQSIANNLHQFAPAVQKIVVTTALALPPEKQSIWTAAQIRLELEEMGIHTSWQKIGLVAKQYGIQCPKEEQENEFGFWATTSVNNFSKVVPQFQYRQAGRDRLVSIFTATMEHQPG